MIKKADILLFIAILVIGGLISWWSLGGNLDGDKVLITADGKTFGIYSLYDDRQVDVTIDGHTNYITIKDGHVAMSYSTCKNQVCTHTGAISRIRDTIVCLPNKVVVEIISENPKQGGDVDVISG